MISLLKENGDYRIGSIFRKFYLIKISFTFGEPVSLVKVFSLNTFTKETSSPNPSKKKDVVPLSIGRASAFVCDALFLV
jgi:hypothetical protein